MPSSKTRTRTRTKMPRELKIGYLWVPLEAADIAVHGNLGSWISAPRARILYDHRLVGVELARVLLHEAFHGMVHVSGADSTAVETIRDHEEFYVDVLSKGMFTLMRDNPQFFRWMNEQL